MSFKQRRPHAPLPGGLPHAALHGGLPHAALHGGLPHAALHGGPQRRQRGFTILEIVIVFILIAGIMAFVGPKIFEQMNKAKSSEARIRMQSLAGNIEIFRLEVGRYPENLDALVKQPGGMDKWNGPYAKDSDLKDAWANQYRYTVPGQGKGFDLISLGADGRDGGEGENRDIAN